MERKRFNNLYCDDCRIALKELRDNSVDGVVTDTPYLIGFMGKKWEEGGITYNVDMWKEVKRVLKPGGHMLVFGGTRTYHRMVCAVEDAGFECKDAISWTYGSGFPKSLDVGKAIDKMAGIKRKSTPLVRCNGTTQYNKKGGGWKQKSEKYVHHPICKNSTEAAKKWDGWGTALKPAHELILVARKPLSEPNVASNVLKWGCGGINVDGCRVGNEKIFTHNAPKGTFAGGEQGRGSDTNSYKTHQGRWPANFLLSHSEGCVRREENWVCEEGCPVKLLDGQSGERPSGGRYGDSGSGIGARHGIYQKGMGGIRGTTYFDTGGAPRFFKTFEYEPFYYCAKASRRERNEGLEGKTNGHPTVKPVTLCRYLCRLITPPDGVVLDPFMGSGSTGIACIEEGFKFIGIEKEKEYFDIAKARIEHAKKKQKKPKLRGLVK